MKNKVKRSEHFLDDTQEDNFFRDKSYSEDFQDIKEIFDNPCIDLQENDF